MPSLWLIWLSLPITSALDCSVLTPKHRSIVLNAHHLAQASLYTANRSCQDRPLFYRVRGLFLQCWWKHELVFIVQWGILSSSNLSAVSKPQLCPSSSSLMDMVLTAIFRFVKNSVQNAPQTVSPMVPRVSLGAWISFKNCLPAHPPIPAQRFIHFYTTSFIATKTSISCSQMLFSTFSFSLIMFLSLHFHCLSPSSSHSARTLVSSIAEQDNCPALTQILLRQVIYSNHRNFSCHLGDHTK